MESENNTSVRVTESRDLRDEFRRTARKYRRWQLYMILLVSLAFVFLGLLLRWRMIGGFGLIVCFAVLFIANFFSPRLICPGCNYDLSGELAAFCPECGAASIKRQGLLLSPVCLTCGKRL